MNELKIIEHPKPKFTERGELNYCDQNHEWELLIFKDNLGVAICKKCAQLQGGFVKYE